VVIAVLIMRELVMDRSGSLQNGMPTSGSGPVGQIGKDRSSSFQVKCVCVCECLQCLLSRRDPASYTTVARSIRACGGQREANEAVQMRVKSQGVRAKRGNSPTRDLLSEAVNEEKMLLSTEKKRKRGTHEMQLK
jgi:hypothetical protein